MIKNCKHCDGELEELPTRNRSRKTHRCLDCGRQEISLEIKKTEMARIPEWKSKCIRCSKWVIGYKRFCTIDCWRKDKVENVGIYK